MLSKKFNGKYFRVICSKRPSYKYNLDRNTAFLELAAILAILTGGGCGNASTTTTVNQVVVTISPASTSVATSTPQQFTATVTGTKNTKVTWSATAGTISDSGLYTAPATVPNPSVVTVTATSVADTVDAAAAQVTIVAGPNAISVSLFPVSGTVANFGTLQFVASVTGDPNTAVTWYVNGIQGGSQFAGYISNSGLYVAPGGVPTQSNGSGSTKAGTARVTAVLTDNTAYSATANVTILPANQSIQTTPIELGTSGGNPNDTSTENKVTVCCGGTLGALIALDGTQYILSTNHILARSDAANIGDPIVQPGLSDANCDSTRTTTISNLSGFFPFQNSQPPNIDAAIAQVVPGKVDAGGKILYLGDTTDANSIPVAGAPHAGAGLPVGVDLIGRGVAKSGRTTGLTCSTIDSIEMAVTVEYLQNCDGTGIPINVQFTGQLDIAGSAFSAQGDSGSLMVSQDTADPIGLLFAASDSSSVANPISDVLNYFQDAHGNVPAVVGGTAHGVIGCRLPAAPASAQSAGTAAALTNSVVANAIRTRDAHLSEILANAEVEAVGLGTSRDNPSEAAILLFVMGNQPRSVLPRQIEGVRTRIIQAATLPRHGELSVAESAKVEETVQALQFASTLSESEFRRAHAVHSANVTSLLKQQGVQGVGISPSLDSPNEAALMIFLVRGAAHEAIPAVIDGVRTRVTESNRFRANYGGAQPNPRCTVPPKKPSPTGSPREQ